MLDDGAAGTLFMAYSDASNLNKLKIIKQDAPVIPSWHDLGSVPVEIGSTSYNNFIIDGSNRYVSVYDGQASYTLKLEGNNWSKLGSADIAPGAKPLDTFAYNGEMYAAFTDITKNFSGTVKKFNGVYWKTVGNSGFTSGINGTLLKTVSLSVSEQKCYFAYIDSVTGKANVMYYNMY